MYIFRLPDGAGGDAGMTWTKTKRKIPKRERRRRLDDLARET
jgi:hypothetical protein